MPSESKHRGKAFAIATLLLVGCAAAFVVWQQAKWRQRESALERGAVIDETADPMAAYRRLCRGKELAGDGRYAEALPIFEEIAHGASNPSYKWDADIQAGDAMAHLGRHSDALARLDRIIQECPLKEDVPNAQLAKAGALSLAGRNEEATKLLEGLVMTYTDTWPRICEESLTQMVAVYGRVDQPGLARATLARLITDYPGAEESVRRWAQGQTTILTEVHRKLQEARIAELASVSRLVKLGNLGPGLTVLTAERGPYLVAAPLQVGHGQELRMEPGTQLRFGVTGSLQIAGRLEVLGTPDKPVAMLPLSDDATKDWWQGIEVGQEGQTRNPSRLSHCRVLGAEIGLHVRAGAVEMDNCTFDRCGRVSVQAGRGSRLSMASCQIVGGYRIGVEAQQASRLELDACRIAGVTTHGVLLQEAAEGSRVRRSRIEKCGRAGVLIRGRCVPTIDTCEVLEAADDGIDAIEGASPMVLNTRVGQSGGMGIRIRERSEAVIRGCRVTGSKKTGIEAEARCAGEVVNNHIEGNGDSGMCLRLGCTTKVEGNSFVGNKGVGLLVQNSQPASVRGNRFSENSDAALRNEGPDVIHAESNWWGSTREADIARSIQDRQDNPAWGQVEFHPWLAGPAPPSESETGPVPDAPQ